MTGPISERDTANKIKQMGGRNSRELKADEILINFKPKIHLHRFQIDLALTLWVCVCVLCVDAGGPGLLNELA